MKCAVVECHEPRSSDLVLDVNPEFDRSVPTAFCARHLVEFQASPEAKQPKRGAADFVERRWKETMHVDAVIRGRAAEAEYEARMKADPVAKAQAEALERDRLARLERWQMPVIAKSIVPNWKIEDGAVKLVPVAARGTTVDPVELERRAAQKKWESDPPLDLTEKEKLK